ncbi:hypothetical protein [Thalassovita aquimarina]|uniref:Uncharacterized protein n=1 Tax=Thalassovita aquimarina TaxID=2785917 RepID=A0ABS5HSF4_9RHOB|nr:hypothetical protein [Thalassovita aquimarina]MBR9651897.1 hypothetical protein [Thalassovita aquimarina]
MSARTSSAKAAEKLSSVFHPKWSPSDDHFVLTHRAKGVPFDRIAFGLKRERVAVEQRWHRLRVVPGVLKLLEAYGLTSAPYPAIGGDA